MKFRPFLLYSFFSIFFSICLILAGIYLYLAPKLPSIESLKEIKLQTPLRVYSQNLKLIGEFGEKRRIPISYANAPPFFVQAILSAEDDRFFSHSGVDIKGLLRAASQLLSTGHIQTGGSTITMQVARNFFLSSDKTFARKFNEILLALQIERELSKEDILELYINKIYLGNRAYGLGAAAQVYYGLSAHELDLAQLAMIAGLPKAPSSYNPIINPERALIRRNWILDRMLKLGYIDQFLHETAKDSPISAQRHGLQLDLNAPYVAEMARKFALGLYGNKIYTDGYRIITTVDAQLQAQAQTAVRAGILSYDQRHGYRGIEGHIDIDLNTLTDDDGLADTLKELNALPVYASLEPAVIMQLDSDSIRVLMQNGQLHKLDWSQIQNKLKPYISENRIGPAPKNPESLFTVGDIIRLQATSITSNGNSSATPLSISQLPKVQAALIAINPEDGGIISIVGGFDFNQSKYNRVIQAKRQPGSNFKPFIYTTAIEHGMTPATLINDAPIVFDDNNLENSWRPENASGQFFGPTRLRKALYKSRNLVSIRVLKTLGINKAINGIERFGFDGGALPRDLSLALGSYAVPPLKIAAGYTAFANGGYKVEPYLVSAILDSQDDVLYQAQPFTVCRGCSTPTESSPEKIPDENLNSLLNDLPSVDEELQASVDSNMAALIEEPLPNAPRIIDERVAYIIDSMLKDVIKKGTARKALVLNRHDLAGKTGTTNGPTDAWFSGYHSSLVTTTWLGFDNNHKLGKREYGGSAALPIWINFMRQALKNQPETVVTQPDGLVTVRINTETGKRAGANDEQAIFEIFREENAPEEIYNRQNESTGTQEESMPDDIF